jgi:hypothetical protein
LALATWPLASSRAALRCYPTKRFVAIEGNLVSDTLTNLVWQQQASGTTMTWAAAQTYCPPGLRLPTLKELRSIVDFTVAHPGGPMIDQTAFPNTPSQGFWTSSPYIGSAGNGWAVYFDNGDANYGSGSLSVRCVR